MNLHSFKKEERLCNKRLLNSLFHSGSSFLLYPFRVTFLPSQEPVHTAQVVLSVPKRRFKRAVDRNLLKRRMREAYRLNKFEFLYRFLQEQSVHLLLSVQYIGKEIHDYHFIEKKLIAVLLRLKDEYAQLYLGENK